jgi:hypothetical protein
MEIKTIEIYNNLKKFKVLNVKHAKRHYKMINKEIIKKPKQVFPRKIT